MLFLSELAQPKGILLYFATKENPKIVHNLIGDIKYILKNNLSQNIFKENHLDFDPLLEGYSSEKEWFEDAHIILLELNRE